MRRVSRRRVWNLGLYVGVPCKLEAKGLEQILEIKLTTEEQTALNKSADAVKELCTVVGVAYGEQFH